MPRESRSLLAFNRGLISKLGLARTDLPRTALSAEVMTNWMPRALGSMMFRPGWEYIDNTNGDEKAFLIPFIFAFSDQAQLEVTDGEMRVRVDDELIARGAVTAAITNGEFDANITNWTDADEGSAVSAWSAGSMGLTGTGTDAAIRYQTVTCNEPDEEHALRIVIGRGPVILRVGSGVGLDDFISETTLGTGTHSLAFTPTGDFTIQFMNRRGFRSLVDSVAIEAAGTMSIPTPWDEDDFSLIRTQQSGDIIYVAARGYQQRKIERRDNNSWSVVLYEPETGPFRGVNTSPITLTPSGIEGNITLTASKPYFKSTNVGSLFRIQSSGQNVAEDISAQDTFTDPIRVAGVTGGRIFGIIVSGTFTATVTLQYSVGEPGSWIDAATYTSATSTSYDDGQDNQIIYYRIGVKSGDYGSGTAEVQLVYSSGSIIGIARATAYTSTTQMSAIVLQAFGAATASADWWEGKWSDRRGWPSAVCIIESRMGMFGRDAIDLSITDQFEDFDDEFEGDAGPISRSIGEGPIETIPWALALTRLVVGTESSSANIAALKIQGNNPLTGRSSSLDEPLTPTNFNLKTSDPTGMFVDTSRTRLLELDFDINKGDYSTGDLSVATPDLNEDALIVGISVQYKPDLRIHCWREDGTVAVLVRDRAENVLAWLEVETNGTVENVCVMPGTVEDRVYYVVRRGSQRFIEKWALESECRGGTLNKQADAFVAFDNGSPSDTVTGLPYADGTEVVCWADGRDLSPDNEDGTQQTYTVSGGEITLLEEVTQGIVGLAYEARWKSGKLAFAAALGSAFNVKGKIGHIGFILLNAHCKGLKYGPDFDNLDAMPLVEEEEVIDPDTVHEDYDKAKIEFDADWETDPRVCLLARAPRPVTISAVTVDLTKSG